jgi:hypothetical protein
MSDSNHGKSVVLNWRGPLLAAGIFAAAFAILLLMAHQNESKTSDMGSSLREDPYGTSLLFDAYRHAGYQVRRGQDQDSLSDQDASRTTAFFIGGYPLNDWTMSDGKIQAGAKFSKRLESFLARGGRVILVEPRWELKSQSQGWQIENAWESSKEKKQKHASFWVSPKPAEMPSGSETIYLSDYSPWLQGDAQWVTLYEEAAGEDNDNTPAHVYMAVHRAGKGELIAASQESFLLNEAIKTHPNPVLLDFLAGGRPVIWVDETLHGLHQEEGVLWLVQRYRLQAALLLFWMTLLVLLWSMSGDLARRPTANAAMQVMREGEAAGVAIRRLLQRSVSKEHVVVECWEQFRRCWPQDARAIAEDPRWGERLRIALTQTPLAGYKELSQLITERRASAKDLARPDQDALNNSTQNLR